MKIPIIQRTIKRLKAGWYISTLDELASEEPLEIVLDDLPYSVTMRLPGDDEHLALGFLYTEGVISSMDDVAGIRHCTKTVGENRLHVTLKSPRTEVSTSLRVSLSSCGLCGPGTLQRLEAAIPPVTSFNTVPYEKLFAMRRMAEAQQAVFTRTGATHFAAVFDRERGLLGFAEDLGRHNALDKSIGQVLAQDRLEIAHLVLVSSRLSLEMVQKAGVLGVEIIAGMSVASSLAVELAESLGITLVGQLRENQFNVYTHCERLSGLPTSAKKLPMQVGRQSFHISCPTRKWSSGQARG
jgi:FdhD protein